MIQVSYGDKFTDFGLWPVQERQTQSGAGTLYAFHSIYYRIRWMNPMDSSSFWGGGCKGAGTKWL